MGNLFFDFVMHFLLNLFPNPKCFSNMRDKKENKCRNIMKLVAKEFTNWLQTMLEEFNHSWGRNLMSCFPIDDYLIVFSIYFIP